MSKMYIHVQSWNLFYIIKSLEIHDITQPGVYKPPEFQSRISVCFRVYQVRESILLSTHKTQGNSYVFLQYGNVRTGYVRLSGEYELPIYG